MEQLELPFPVKQPPKEHSEESTNSSSNPIPAPKGLHSERV